MSTTFAEGDLVEATKGDRRVIDRVYVVKSQIFTTGPYLGAPSLFLPSSIQSFKSAGFTLTLIEKATPPLPTEPGWYTDCRDDIWRVSPTGAWTYSDTWRSASEAATYAPFTRLEPVAETAKKVLDRVSDCLVRGGFRTFPNEFGNLATEFGVTS